MGACGFSCLFFAGTTQRKEDNSVLQVCQVKKKKKKKETFGVCSINKDLISSNSSNSRPSLGTGHGGGGGEDFGCLMIKFT